MELREKVTVTLVNRACAHCGFKLVSTEKIIMNNPPRYEHICYACSKVYVFEKQYPYPEYTPC